MFIGELEPPGPRHHREIIISRSEIGEGEVKGAKGNQEMKKRKTAVMGANKNVRLLYTNEKSPSRNKTSMVRGNNTTTEAEHSFKSGNTSKIEHLIGGGRMLLLRPTLEVMRLKP